jgi:hypothetical protein
MAYNKSDPLYKEKTSANLKRYRERHLELCKARRKADYYKNKERDLLAHAEYVKTHKEQILADMKRHRTKIVLDVINAYGGKCACCGETNLMFLTLDHVNNDGKEYRKHSKDRYKEYRRAIEDNYPDNLQVLCYNCNCGKSRNGGICPHKQSDSIRRI